MPTVELGNFGHGDDLDGEARGKPMQELGFAQAASAAGWPREMIGSGTVGTLASLIFSLRSALASPPRGAACSCA
jgi:hypothetical protein